MDSQNQSKNINNTSEVYNITEVCETEKKSNKKKYKKRKQFNNSDPITSYGLILFSKCSENPLFLIYQRRDSFEYMDFLRGAWNSEGQLPALFSLMSEEERERIRNYIFQELWDDLWIIQECRIYKDGFFKAKKKYDSIKSRIPDLLNSTTSCINYPPWGFPKGKKNGYHEDHLKCAIREFEEETKISISSELEVIQDVLFEENFKGSNGKTYATYYYLGNIQTPIYPDLSHTPHCIRKTTISEEASSVKWISLNESKEYLNSRRQTILQKAFGVINQDIS